MFSPKKRVPPTSMTTRSTTARVQTKKIHATSVISPSRPVLRERENKHVVAPMTPPKKTTKTPKSPYDSPSSPIASAKKVTSKPVRQLIKEETAKSTKSSETRDVKSNTLFSPAYKIEALDENHHRQSDSNTKDGSAVIEIEVESTTCTTQVTAVEEEDCEDEFDPFLFIKNLPPLPIDTKPRKFLLPKRVRGTPPVCLALDLDETLVHCSIQPIEKAELTFSVAFNGTEYKVYVRMRPYLAKFLRQVSAWFEIVVFTASQRVYADKLLNILDPKRRYIKHRVFRDSCVCVDGNYLKDLTVLGRDLSKVAIVDNSVQAFGFQLNNGIPIESWFDDDSDEELLNLLPFLQKLKDVKDVRPLISKTFRLEEFVNSL